MGGQGLSENRVFKNCFPIPCLLFSLPCKSNLMPQKWLPVDSPWHPRCPFSAESFLEMDHSHSPSSQGNFKTTGNCLQELWKWQSSVKRLHSEGLPDRQDPGRVGLGA